jgi:hypothetical protein
MGGTQEYISDLHGMPKPKVNKFTRGPLVSIFFKHINDVIVTAVVVLMLQLTLCLFSCCGAGFASCAAFIKEPAKLLTLFPVFPPARS